MIKIGFTGTRHGMTQAQRAAVYEFLYTREGGEFHHGDCIGADAEAHDVAAMAGFDPNDGGIVVHPPTDPKARAFKTCSIVLDPLPYLVRNRAIVDETSWLIATPAEAVEQARGGTWYTVRYARSLKKNLRIFLPDGTALSG